ncbi:MAG: hypothetical protein M1833_003932 [Piccolia ochrophora]|nr:MAG: hypothetical protein M1833_003932 [Piccolia ochrophora]
MDVGIGTAGLAFQVLAACVKTYELLCDAKAMPKNYRYLRTRLKMEESRLLDWSKVAGLLEKGGPQLSGGLIMNRALLLDILTEIQATLNKFGKLEGKYEELRPLQHIDGVEPSLVNGAFVAQEDALGGKKKRLPSGTKRAVSFILDTINSIPTAPKRLKWAQFDQAKFEQLVKRLTDMNDHLHGLLDENLSNKLLHTQHQTQMEVLQLHNSVNDIKELVKALSISRVVLESSSAITDSSANKIRQRNGEEERRLAQLAKFKEFNIEGAGEERSTRLDYADFTFNDDNEIATNTKIRWTEATYKAVREEPRRVWIEWKDYDPDAAYTAPNKRLLLQRVEQLAALLRSDKKPEAFRVPRCLGYFEDSNQTEAMSNSGLGFVFEKPSHVDPNTPPISLLQLLSKPKPSLTDRIALANEVAQSLFYLHSVNWLHKGLRSHNIVFFPTNEEPDYQQPYLTGFDYSRPAPAEELTEKPPENAEFDVYRHPNAHGDSPKDATAPTNPFKKTYDIYALGIILLEIALWTDITAIVGIADIKTARPADTRRIRDRLLDEDKHAFLQDVRANVGNIYADAVKACLRGAEGFGLQNNAKETDEAVAAELQQAFTEKVVERLEGLKF